MPRLIPAALLAALLAPVAASAGDGRCTGTLSGAVQGTFTCSVTATSDATTAQVVITADAPIPGVRTLTPARFELRGPMTTGTRTLATLGKGGASLETAGGARYAAAGERGEVTLTVEQAERYPHVPGVAVSGPLDARLVPASGAEGEVRMKVTF